MDARSISYEFSHVTRLIVLGRIALISHREDFDPPNPIADSHLHALISSAHDFGNENQQFVTVFSSYFIYIIFHFCVTNVQWQIDKTLANKAILM